LSPAHKSASATRLQHAYHTHAQHSKHMCITALLSACGSIENIFLKKKQYYGLLIHSAPNLSLDADLLKDLV